jgi:hypothetical protein
MENFNFRSLHPQAFIGTASDRYAGWIGQIYSQDRYAGRITQRTKIIGGRTFAEEVLPRVLRTFPGPGDRFHFLPAAVGS